MNTKAFYHLSYGLYIISSVADGKACGCVVNTLAQVTSKPAKVSIAVNKDNATTQAILKSGRFVGVSLAQSADMDLIGEFGFKTSTERDKFAPFTCQKDENGIPYVTEHTTARFSGKVVDQLDLGTHILFVAEVTEAEVLSEEEVLTYAYYQKVKKGGTPKNAPSYKEEAAPAQEPAGGKIKGYQCTICGYILESDTLPPDFVCPICGMGADKFKPIYE